MHINLPVIRRVFLKEVKVTKLDDNVTLPDGSPNPNFGKNVTTTERVISMAPNAGSKKLVRKLYDDAFEKSFSGLPVASTMGDYKNLANLNPSEIAKYGYRGWNLIHLQENYLDLEQ